MGALLVLRDEVVLHLFAAASVRSVREVSLAASVDAARVLETLPIGLDGTAPSSDRLAD